MSSTVRTSAYFFGTEIIFIKKMSSVTAIAVKVSVSWAIGTRRSVTVDTSTLVFSTSSSGFMETGVTGGTVFIIVIWAVDSVGSNTVSTGTDFDVTIITVEVESSVTVEADIVIMNSTAVGSIGASTGNTIT